jgi:hypothetical protein
MKFTKLKPIFTKWTQNDCQFQVHDIFLVDQGHIIITPF